jgi:hypothetical protein
MSQSSHTYQDVDNDMSDKMTVMMIRTKEVLRSVQFAPQNCTSNQIVL